MVAGGFSPYVRRVVDRELDELMAGLAAIALEGPRGVGKTRTALERARTVYRLDDPATRALLTGDPARITTGDRPILIDEWQVMPETWDIVRRAVDDDRTPGQFILAGSAMPTGLPHHTGAGRIVPLRMRTMTLSERGVDSPTVSLTGLLRGDHPPLEGTTHVRLDDYAREIVASGFPGLRGLGTRALRAQLDGYIERIIDRDFQELGGRTVRNPAALRRWLCAYASAVSSSASYEKIRDAATAGHDEKPAKTTVLAYIDVLERLWLADPIRAWAPTRSSLTRLAQAPKHHLLDPALAVRLLGVDIGALLAGDTPDRVVARNATLLGALFEALVALDVRTYAQAAEARVAHFRTRNGDHEVDIVVERSDRRVLAIEVKLAHAIDDDDVQQLRWLRDRLGEELIDAVVVSTGTSAYRRRDGIAVVPAALLGP